MSLKLEPRKVTAINYTLFVSLPKMWVDFHNITKGQSVGIEVSDDQEGRVLILRPYKNMTEYEEKNGNRKIDKISTKGC